MDGELAFAIALAAHGNAFVASAEESRPAELFDTNSTLQHASSVTFREGEASLQSAADAIRRTEQGRYEDLRSPKGTSAWFLRLRRAAGSRLQVVKLPTQLDLPEVYAASFSGAIPWAILVDYPSTFGLWIPRWKHEDGKKPWKVSVTGFTVARPPSQPHLQLQAAANSLRAALERALDFSTRAKLEWFPTDFSHALGLLSSQSPEIPYHPDLLPPRGYSLLSRQVTASAAKAWVFGGMGSFNDLVLKGHGLKAEYKGLLPDVYNSVVNALLAAANSFGRE